MAELKNLIRFTDQAVSFGSVPVFNYAFKSFMILRRFNMVGQTLSNFRARNF